MEKNNLLTKILAAGGTLLVWFPVLAPVLITLVFAISEREFRFDYLMPAELFPFALLGGAMLVWAALRARSHRGMIGWGLVTAVIMLIGAQLLAVVTGLASGETEPVGLWWALAITGIIIYSLAVVEIGVGGALLLGDLFRKSGPAAGSA